jgi:hypothetical protein
VVLKLSTEAPRLSGTGLSPSMAGLSSAVPLDSKFVTPWCVCGRTCRRLLLLTRNAHMLTRARFGLFPFRSPLLRESFLFLEVLRCFSSPRALRHTYVFSMRYPGIPLGGFPHSEISGSTLVGNSPELFAACCVLHRPLAPRHPPCALSSLIYASSLQDFCSHSVQFLRCLLPHSTVEMRGLEPLTSSVQGRRSPI